MFFYTGLAGNARVVFYICRKLCLTAYLYRCRIKAQEKDGADALSRAKFYNCRKGWVLWQKRDGSRTRNWK